MAPSPSLQVCITKIVCAFTQVASDLTNCQTQTITNWKKTLLRHINNLNCIFSSSENKSKNKPYNKLNN